MDKVYRDGYNFFFWNYEEQTKMKHTVFGDYFDIWVKKLGCRSKINYFDCFGGSGAYIDKSDNIYYGSPIIATRIEEDNRKKLNRRVNINVIEKDRENIDNLYKIFKFIGLPIPNVIYGDFDEQVNKYLNDNRNNINPTFFFIDPFGFSVNYKTLKRIMSIPKCEIFLNFMFTRINEFLSYDKIESIFNDLFGCTDWKKCKDLKGSIREEKIVGLFKTQAKKFSKYVFPFRMSFPNKDRTYYYLIHLTNNKDGCSIMKSSFAKYNHGRVEYLGKNQELISIFDMNNVKTEEIQKYLSIKYEGEQVSFNEIIENEIDEVFYLESEIRNAIKELIKQGNVTTIPVDSKTGKGLKGNDCVIFHKRSENYEIHQEKINVI